jgi:hypothetical protein
MSLDRTRRLLALQGYCGLTDRAAAELDPWLRVAPAFCAGWTLVATLGGASNALWLLAAIAACGAVLPVHPFDLPYNLVIRHWTGTAPIPTSALPRRFACAVAAVWLAATATALAAGAVTLGVALGVVLTLTALVPVTTGFCVPSWVLTQILRPRARGAS